MQTRVRSSEQAPGSHTLSFIATRSYSSRITFGFFDVSHLPKNSFIICDPAIQLSAPHIPILYIDSNESNKSLAGADLILEFLQKNQATRQSTLVAVGGGSLLDLTGFVASIYMRGIDWWAIPTTLLAMVDASVGGKTAINMHNVKNLIGSFHPAVHTLCDQSFLTTLSDQHLSDGMAEIIKMAWTSDAELWNQLETSPLPTLISRAVNLKLRIINNDWFESLSGTDRLVLNAGHTFGHAFERLHPQLTHGQAVALGLVAEHTFAQTYTKETHAITDIEKMLCHFGLPTDYKSCLNFPDQLIDLMQKDKKSALKNIKFIVAKKPGYSYTLNCSPNDVRTFVCSQIF